MKKVIRLTESDLIRIVKKVINENAMPQYDYIFERNDGYTDRTAAQKLFFVSNGDSFDVWAEEYTNDGSKGRMVNTGRKLPTLSDIGITFNESAQNFKNSDGSLEGNDVAHLITAPMERSKGNWIFFVNKEGVPSKGRLKVANGLPIKGMLDTKGKGYPLEDNQTITGTDYFIVEKPSRKNEYGKGTTISIEEVEKSKPA